MELAIKQIIGIIIAIVLATLIILFILGKIGADGSITKSVLSMLTSAEGGLQ